MRLAAVDLGSNSFRLEIGEVEGELILPRDDLKVTVRLAAGLTPERLLTAEAMGRGWQALAQFGERLRGFARERVRAVATNTLRVARNASQFIAEGEELLGFPIEVISGVEEARLIYVGVTHSIAHPERQNLVFDIGGGSTEFIIGRGFSPEYLESLFMGCVGYTRRFFADGMVTAKQFREAYTAARLELETIAGSYRRIGWEQVWVSSGSAKAIRDVAQAMGLTEEEITPEVLQRLERAVLAARRVEMIAHLPGMRPDRAEVFAAGLAIMRAAFDALGIESAFYANGAMRLGVLYDLLGRRSHHDIREASVKRLMERCGVDQAQAARVEATALALFSQVVPGDSPWRLFLSWAAQLHEVGLFVAHASYHKHGAYLLLNADLPGFSQSDQARLARLVLGHRGKLGRFAEAPVEEEEWIALLALRLACALHRAREDRPTLPLSLRRTGKGFCVRVPQGFWEEFPLTASLLLEEREAWSSVGKQLQLEIVP